MKLRVAPDPTPGMLSRGCTGTIPPAFVTRAGAGLVPSAGTRREGLTCAKIPQALGRGILFFFFSVFPGVFGICLGVPSPGAARLWEAEEPLCPWDAPLGCSRSRRSCGITQPVAGQGTSRCSPIPEGPEADAELPQARAGTKSSSLMCHPHRGTCHPLQPSIFSPWSRWDTDI